MRLCFLGTGSGTPTRKRNVSGLALRFEDGREWILDCGEGTQQRMLDSSVRPGRIERIFVTHLHGDHCFGLPGLLASLAVHGRIDPVEVIGPTGIARLARTALSVTRMGLPYQLSFSEFTLAEGEVAELGERGEWTISVLPLPHRVPSHAYLLQEAPRRGRLDPARAAALGLRSGPDLGRLAGGETIALADGRQIGPEQVLGPPRPGRLLALCGDTSDASVLLGRAEGCDLLLHECTYAHDRLAKARRWGHSTAQQVGELAARLAPRRLVLTHFSSRYDEGPPGADIAALRAEAAAACPGVEVVAAEDLLELELPQRG